MSSNPKLNNIVKGWHAATHEWIIITDPQTQANALGNGEVDMIEMPAFELYRSLKRHPDIQMLELNPLGGQNYLRFNQLEPPFDNPKVRRAAMAALNKRNATLSPTTNGICLMIWLLPVFLP